MKSIFFSYSHKDKEIVDKISSDLKMLDVFIWIDKEEIKLGDSLINRIREGIDRVDYVAVIISKNSINSEWVKKEVDVAMNQEIEGKKIKVLPILIDDIDLPWFLKGKLYADFSSKEKYRDGMRLLIDRLEDDKSIHMSINIELKKILEIEGRENILELYNKLSQIETDYICDESINEERIFREKAEKYGLIRQIEPSDQEKCYGDWTVYSTYVQTILGRKFIHWCKYVL